MTSSYSPGSAPATGNLFGAPPKPAEGNQASSENTAASTPGLPGGSLFGTTAGTASTAPPASTPASTFSLGGNKETTAQSGE